MDFIRNQRDALLTLYFSQGKTLSLSRVWVMVKMAIKSLSFI